MALNELFLEIYIAMLCINGGILLVDSLVDTPLKSPFDSSANVTAITTGDVTDIFNSTDDSGTLVGNFTGTDTLNNSTLGGNPAVLIPYDPFNPIAMIWTFIEFLTGGFVFQVLGLFGLPAAFTYIMQAIFGILLARIIIYYWLGR